MTDQINREYNAWREVCALLRETKAVTDADMKAKLGSSGTPGMDLVNAIIKWGDELVLLRGGTL